MENNRPINRFSAIFLVLVVCLLVAIPSVSALEFDNVKSYDAVTRTVTITNAYGLGDDIGQAKLLTPLNVKVGAGYQKVAEFEISAYQDYNDAIKQFTFTDMKKKEKINREFDLKYLTYEEVEIDDYELYNCNEETICEQRIIGTHTETREKWTKVTPADLKKNEKLTIGIFTDVQIGDYVDWIPTIYGVEIEEWAVWTYDLNTDLVAYYTLDEASGTIKDSVSTNDGTLTNAHYGYEGIIGDAIYFDGSGDYITIPQNLQSGTSFAFSVWLKPDVSYTATLHAILQTQSYFTRYNDGGIKFGINSDAYSVTNGVSITNGNWYHYLVTYDGSYIDVYFNGTRLSHGAYTAAMGSHYAASLLGKYSTSYYWKGSMDEVGFWDRGLTSDEVAQLYNDGNGITYTTVFNEAPTITLNSPTEDANYTTPQSLTFNYTASDDVQLSDVKFYVNDVLNQTNATGINNSDYLFDLTLGDGSYTMYAIATDNESETTQSDNVTIVIDTTPNIQYTGNTRVDNYNSSSPYLPIEVTLTETYFDTVSFNVNGTVTNYTDGTRLYNESNVDGTYDYNVTVYTTTGQSNTTETRTINIDATLPAITITAPTGTYDSFIVGDNETLNYSISDTNLDSCWVQYPSLNNLSTKYSISNSSTYFNFTDLRFDIDGDLAFSFIIETGRRGVLPRDNWKLSTPTYSIPSCLDEIYSSGVRYWESNQYVCANDGSDYYIIKFSENIPYTSVNLTFNATSYFDFIYDINCSGTSIDFEYTNGYNNLTVFANDTFGNVNSETTSWSYNITEVSQTYPTSSLESKTEAYTANVSYNSTKYGIINSVLYVNGTSYIGTRTGTGDDAVMSANAVMPPVDSETNLTAYWTISLTDEDGITSYNLTSNNVTVQAINLTLCDETNNIPFWNFTVLNESNDAAVNVDFVTTFTVRVEGSTDENIFTFSDVTTANNEFDFCVSPGTDSYSVDTNIQLSATGYVSKYYDYNDIILTNATREDNLYMLSTGDSTSFIIHVVDVSGTDVEDAEVRVQRYYPGTGLWVTTEIVTTNYIGETIGHLLSEDADYRFLVYEDGISTYNSTATKIICDTAPCTVTLVIPINFQSGYITVEDLTSTLTYSSTTNVFTYTYTDTSGDFDSARLYVLRLLPSNATLNVPCNEIKTTASGIITCDISGQVNGTYRADGYITRDGTEFLDRRLNAVLGTNIYNSMGNDGVLWGMFVLIGIIMIGVARPSMAIIFGTIGLFTLGIIGMINISIISLVAITAIGIILLMRVGKE